MFFGTVLFDILIFAVSYLVEGIRKAKDRLVTSLVSTAFVIALLPLISLVFTVVVDGWKRFDMPFFTYSMRNIVGEGGGALHAIVGTLEITGMATLISVPIGLLAAIYLVEYGRGHAGAGDHLLRRRDDRHPLDRRRPVRVRPVRAAVRRPGHPVRASAARSR